MFAVQACNDVHVALAQYEGNFDSQSIEIVIGGWQNERSVLRNEPQGSTMETIFGKFLDCGVAKKFRIDWNNTSIRLGRGDTINDEVLLSFQSLSHPVNYIGIYTAYGSDGIWTFEIPNPSSDQESTTVKPANFSTSSSPASVNYAESTSSPGQHYTSLHPSSISSSTPPYLNRSKSSIIPESDINDTEMITTIEKDIFQFGSTNVNQGTSPSYNGESSSNEEIKAITFSTDFESTDNMNSSTCSCICYTHLTENETKLKIEEMKEILSMNKRNLSSARRRLHSVDDMRPVSVTIGMLMGILVLACTFCLIIIPDIISFIHYLYLCTHPKKTSIVKNDISF